MSYFDFEKLISVANLSGTPVNGTPAIVEESLMACLMGQAGPDGIISARSNLKIGQQIMIDGGPFDGLVGIIQEPPNAKGRVKVLIELLKRPTKVEVPVRFTTWRTISR